MPQPTPELCSVFCEHVGRLDQFLSRRLASRDDVEDVAQEVFLRLVRVEDLKQIEHPRAFLLRAADNALKDRYRRRQARGGDKHIPLEDVELVSEDVSPDRVVEAKQRLNQIEDAMYALSPNQRTALLHRFDGKAHAEVAAEMGVSVSMVEKLVRDARLRLEDSLRKRAPRLKELA